MATAAFTFGPAQPYARQDVVFADLSVDATEWAWDFGDGANAAVQHPTHAYPSATTYTVALTINASTTPVVSTQTITVRNAIVYNGIELSSVAPWERDLMPVANDKDLLGGGVSVQTIKRDKRQWEFVCLAETRAEILALEAIRGEKHILVVNGEMFAGVVIAPPFKEIIHRDGTHFYTVSFKQELYPQ